MRRPRRHLAESGPVRSLAAMPAVPRQRHRDRGSVPALPRLGARAEDEALHGEDSRGSQGRLADPPARQGRRRLRRRGGGRSLGGHAVRAVEGLHAPRRRSGRRGLRPVLGRRARRQGRGADPGWAGHGQGEARHVRRHDAAREGQGRPPAEGLGARRPARTREADRAEEAEQEAARAARRAAEGGRLMARHDELLEQGPREAPEPETAEQRSKRLGVGTVAGGTAVVGGTLAKLGFLKIFLWIFAWHGVISLWQVGGWVALLALAAGATVYLVVRSRREAP